MRRATRGILALCVVSLTAVECEGEQTGDVPGDAPAEEASSGEASSDASEGPEQCAAQGKLWVRMWLGEDYCRMRGKAPHVAAGCVDESEACSSDAWVDDVGTVYHLSVRGCPPSGSPPGLVPGEYLNCDDVCAELGAADCEQGFCFLVSGDPVYSSDCSPLPPREQGRACLGQHRPCTTGMTYARDPNGQAWLYPSGCIPTHFERYPDPQEAGLDAVCGDTE